MASKLDRDIQRFLGLPPAVVKKWRTKVAAYKRAFEKVSANEKEASALTAPTNALYKMLDEAAAHVPYTAGQSPFLYPAVQEMERELRELTSGAWERARNAQQVVRDRERKAELERLKDEEAKSPYRRATAWMRE